MLRSMQCCAADPGSTGVRAGWRGRFACHRPAASKSRTFAARQAMSVQCYNVRQQQRSEWMGVDLLNVRGLREVELHGAIGMVNLMRFRERWPGGDGTWLESLRRLH